MHFKVLVAEGLIVGNLYHIKIKFHFPMTLVAGVCEQGVTAFEQGCVFHLNSLADAV